MNLNLNWVPQKFLINNLKIDINNHNNNCKKIGKVLEHYFFIKIALQKFYF